MAKHEATVEDTETTATDTTEEPNEATEAEATEAEETETSDPATTYLSPYKATDLVNAILADAGLKDKKDSSKPKKLPAQMLYRYAETGSLNDGNGNAAFRDEQGKWQVSEAVVRTWAANYVSRMQARAAKAAAKVEADLKGDNAEPAKTDDESKSELVEA
jgi:hypothetical protein